jgi:hypothetical protein
MWPPPSNLWQKVLRYRYFFLFIFSLTLFAVTNSISIGSFNFHVPISDSLFSFATILRSSGRMFLPMFYLLMLGILYLIIHSYSKWVATTLLASAFFIQVIDSAPGWIINRNFLSKTYQNTISTEFTSPLYDPFWQNASRHYKNIVTIFSPPKKGFIPPNWAPFAALAAKYNLSTNSVLLARFDEMKAAQVRESIQKISFSGKYRDDTLYIIGDERVFPALINLNKSRDLFARIDNFNILAPGWLDCASCAPVPKEVIISMAFPPIKNQQTISFANGALGSNFLIGVNTYDNVGHGWAWPEDWGVWSEGSKAQFVLPVPSEGSRNLILTMRALVSLQHPKQEFEIYVNNALLRGVTLTNPKINIIEIPITSAITKDGFIQIEFKFQNPVKPKDLGMGNDGRLVSIGLEDARYE